MAARWNRSDTTCLNGAEMITPQTVRYQYGGVPIPVAQSSSRCSSCQHGGGGSCNGLGVLDVPDWVWITGGILITMLWLNAQWENRAKPALARALPKKTTTYHWRTPQRKYVDEQKRLMREEAAEIRRRKYGR